MNEELETMNEEVSQDIEQQADEATAEQAPQSMLDAVTQALNEDASDAEPEVEIQDVTDEAAAETAEAEAGAEAAVENVNTDAPDAEEMPADASPKAQERIRTLANEVRAFKEREADLVEKSQSIESFQRTIQSAFNNIDEFEQVITYATAIKEGRMADAKDLLLKQVLQFEAMTGESLAGGLLAQYPELKQQVDNFEMDEASAKDYARLKWQQEQQQQAVSRQQQEQQQAHNQQQQLLQQQQQWEADRSQAEQDIGRLAQEWSTSDLNWDANAKALREYVTQHLANVPPSQWVSVASTYYQGLRNSRPQRPSNTPLNPSVPTAAVQAEPKSMNDAVRAAIFG